MPEKVLTQTMKALVKDGNSLAVRNLPAPGSSKPDEVLIRVELAGLCRTDVYAAEGKIKVANPLILGHEFSGVIEAVGSEVDGLAPGSRVTVNPLIPCRVCAFCLKGEATICQKAQFLGVDRNGCFAGFASVPATSVHQLPDHVSFLQAAYSEPIAASLAVLKTGIRPDEHGVIFGKNRFADLLLRIMRTRGFANLDIYDPGDTSQSLHTDTYDYVIETVMTTDSLRQMIEAVRPGGKVILKSRQYEPVMLKMIDVVKREPIIHVVNYGSFEDALSLLSDSQVEVEDLVDDIYKLDEFQKVLVGAEQKEKRKPFFAPWND